MKVLNEHLDQAQFIIGSVETAVTWFPDTIAPILVDLKKGPGLLILMRFTTFAQQIRKKVSKITTTLIITTTFLITTTLIITTTFLIATTFLIINNNFFNTTTLIIITTLTITTTHTIMAATVVRSFANCQELLPSGPK